MAGAALAAQETPRTSARDLAWQEAVRLVREEAEAKERARAAAGNANPAPAAELAVAAGVEVMDPIVVTEKRPPPIRVSRETKAEEFFRTGTMAERVGSKVTSRLWMKGDKGVMWSVSW